MRTAHTGAFDPHAGAERSHRPRRFPEVIRSGFFGSVPIHRKHHETTDASTASPTALG